MGTVLITGGAGFIGTKVTQALLARGIKVRILDSLTPQIHGALPVNLDWLSTEDGIEFHRGSLLDKATLDEALEGVDAVVHLAAETGTGQSMYEISRYTQVNVQGTALLLNTLANDSLHKVKRLVLASSRSIYGEGAYTCEHCDSDKRIYPQARPAEQLAAHKWEHACPECGGSLAPIPTREDDLACPASIYAATKYAQEDLVRIACSSLGMGYAILRLQNVYGEGQSLNNPYTGILSIFSTRIRRNLDLPIFEDGRETRDFVHVSDVAEAFVAATLAPVPINKAINVGSGVGTSVSEVARQLNLAFGGSSEVQVTGQYRLGDIRHNRADITKLKENLRLTPNISLEEGLQRFATWVSSQPLPEDRLDAANTELKARKMMSE
jgi:dTDP-L-rhamnose 4-epimerase